MQTTNPSTNTLITGQIDPVIIRDPYFDRREVSNSDLSTIDKYWLPQNQNVDIAAAYRFGTLVDAIITEPEKIDFFNFTVAGVQYTADEFAIAKQMKIAFYRDEFCRQFADQCSFQKISIRKNFPIRHMDVDFTLDVRCKWDLFVEHFDMSGDIKSTTATTQKQFEAAVRYFRYDRQRAFYMDIENRNNDMLIGISKINFKVFKLPIKRGDDIWKSGREQYETLAFKHWYLFS